MKVISLIFCLFELNYVYSDNFEYFQSQQDKTTKECFKSVKAFDCIGTYSLYKENLANNFLSLELFSLLFTFGF